MLQELVTAPSLKMEVAIMKCDTSPSCWIVQAIDMPNDGSVYTVHFEGPQAEVRAREYVALKYDGQ